MLHVLDASEPPDPDAEARLADLADRNCIVVLNKSDLPSQLGQADMHGSQSVPVSCLNRDGIEALKDAIRASVWDGEITSEMLEVMVNSRHQEALNRAKASLQAALGQLREGTVLDLVAVDLRIATNAIGEIVGAGLDIMAQRGDLGGRGERLQLDAADARHLGRDLCERRIAFFCVWNSIFLWLR